MNVMSTTVPFVILFQGRTGSSYLNSALKSHPDIYTRGEELVELLRNSRFTRISEELTGATARRHRAAGLKTKLADIGDRDAFRDMLQRIDARIVYIGRNNRIKHAVSFFTGARLFESTGHWNLHKSVERNDGKIEIDVGEFDKKLRKIERQNAELRNYVMELELPALCVYYENLVRMETQFIHMVLQFLNVPTIPLRGRTRKNTADDLRAVLANFDKLREFYAETPYARMFDEVITTSE